MSGDLTDVAWQKRHEAYYRVGGDRLVAAREQLALSRTRLVRYITREIPHARVLEIGAGTGAMSRALVATGWRPSLLVATDYTNSGARSVLSMQGPIPNTAVVDAQALPFQSDRFDIVVGICVLEHIIEPVAALRECARVARHIVVELPLTDTPVRRLRSYLDPTFRQRERQLLRLHTFNRTSFKHLARSAGLQIRAWVEYVASDLEPESAHHQNRLAPHSLLRTVVRPFSLRHAVTLLSRETVR